MQDLGQGGSVVVRLSRAARPQTPNPDPFDAAQVDDELFTFVTDVEHRGDGFWIPLDLKSP